MITFSVTKNHQPFFNLAPSWSWLCDQNNTPCHGKIKFDEDKIFCQTRQKSISINLPWEIKNFGQVMVQSSLQHQGEKISLEQSLTKGRIRQIQNEINKCNQEKINLDHQLIKDFSNLQQQTNNFSIKTNVDRLLFSLFTFGEQITLNRAATKIKRKQSQQLFNNFKLGCQCYAPLRFGKKYQDHFKTAFNYATAPLFLFKIYPEKNREDWSFSDQAISWLKKEQIECDGHPLVWLHSYNLPNWMKTISFPSLKKFLRSHIKKVIARYGDHIKTWSIINEFPDGDANGFNLTVNQLLDLAKDVSQQVKALQPKSFCWLNFSEPYGANSYNHNQPSIPPELFISKAINKGVKFDAIGIQFYFGISGLFTCRDLLTISDTVDKFEQFKKPLRITEVSFPSQFMVDNSCFWKGQHPASAGFWHQSWSEITQAKFTKLIYTVFMSKELVDGITWFDFTDRGQNQDIAERFIPHGGLLRKDLSPKPAFQQIVKLKQQLINRNS